MQTEMTDLRGVECVICSIGEGKVVSADRSVGLTIVSLDDGSELYCVNRAEILKRMMRHGITEAEANRVYHESFSEVVRMIRSGEEVEDIILDYRTGNPAWRTTRNILEEGLPLHCAFR